MPLLVGLLPQKKSQQEEVEEVGEYLRPARLGVNGPRIIVGLAAIPAGLLADWAGLPAAWLIGPMLMTLTLGLSSPIRATLPRWLYIAAQAVIGAMLSGSFDPSALATLTRYWLPVTGSIALLLGLSLLSGFLLARFTHLELTTAVLGTIPGGASGMVAMSDELEADTPLVAFMQYTRVVMVAVTASLLARFVLGASSPYESESAAVIDPVSWLGPGPVWWGYLRMVGVATLGAFVGLRSGLPAGAIVGPVLLGVILGSFGIGHGEWPPGVIPTANAVIGINVGLRFHRKVIRQLWGLLPAVSGFAFLLMVGCALLGIALMLITGLDLLSAYLATTPGGIDAVMIAALDTGANTAVILPIHVLRVLVMVLAGPFLARWLQRRSIKRARAQKPHPETQV